jgi:thymidylate synthase
MYLSFHVRHGVLCTTVRMRSQDAVWGLRNDLPFFWLVSDVVAAATGYRQGIMHYSVDSLHVYERHFEKVKKMLRNHNGWIDSELNTTALVEKILNDKLKIKPQAPREFTFGFNNKQLVHMSAPQGRLFTD